MKLTIGKNTYETKQITADFPIRFYKKTGKDIFSLDDESQSIIEKYETILALAYELAGEGKTEEEFEQEFTPFDLIEAYEDIFAIYGETTKPKVKSETEKKQQ